MGRGRQPRPGAQPRPVSAGRSRNSKLSPPPEVSGAEETAGSRLRGVSGRPPTPAAAGEGAPAAAVARSTPPRPAPPSPVPARTLRAARTHLAVELADRHDPACPAGPGAPCGRTTLAGAPAGGGSRLLAAPAALSPRPARLAPSSCAGREFVVSRPFPPPAPPASWRRRGRLAPCRRDLYSRGDGVAAAGPELRAGGGGGRAAPHSGIGGGASAGRGRAAGRASEPAASELPPRLCSPRGRAGRALPRPRTAGSSRPGAGRACGGCRPPPAGRGAHAGQVHAGAAPAAPRSGTSQAVPGRQGGDAVQTRKRKKRKVTKEGQRGIKGEVPTAERFQTFSSGFYVSVVMPFVKIQLCRRLLLECLGYTKDCLRRAELPALRS